MSELHHVALLAVDDRLGLLLLLEGEVLENFILGFFGFAETCDRCCLNVLRSCTLF